MINKDKNNPRKELASTPLEEKTNVQKISHSPLKEGECESLAHIQFTKNKL